VIFIPKQKMEATAKRLYSRVFICMKCNAKMRTDASRIKAKTVKCRKCGYHDLRQKSKGAKK